MVVEDPGRAGRSAGSQRAPTGAAGFGMQTPAGSGRHLMMASLETGWDASLVGAGALVSG